MRNNPENIYDYSNKQITARAANKQVIAQIPRETRKDYASMQQMEIEGKLYYTLPNRNAQMGASEKILLISTEKFQNSISNRDELKPDAILKLPKNNQATQVQSEAMALGIASQALGLSAASATMVCFNNQPALFIPFDDMEPLTNFASSDIKIQRHTNRIDYEDSTINPLGPGLTANLFVEDFGKAFALMYLTGDPDAIGGYNQNKGLQGRNLYVFDQAIHCHQGLFSSNLFAIDSRLRQKPIGMAVYSRHTKGRNFSLIEDASISTKFDSLQYINNEKTIDYINSVIMGLKAATRNVPEHLLAQHLALIKSAENTKTTIRERMNTYSRMLPQTLNAGHETIKNSLILENIISNPRLYSPTGRPYRSLFAHDEHTIKVLRINEDAATHYVTIQFSKNLDPQTLHRMVHHLGHVDYNPKTQCLRINKELLENLENVFYPENDINLKHDIDYLSEIDTIHIAKAYHHSPHYHNKIIEGYKNLKSHTVSDNEVINILHRIREALKRPMLVASDKGNDFNMHMIKRFEFEVQKEVQKIISRNISPERINSAELSTIQDQAFRAAIQLDCIQEFNYACMAITKNIANPEIQNQHIRFLQKYACLDLSNKTIAEAQEIRKDMLIDMQQILTLETHQQADTITERKNEQLHFRNAIIDMKDSGSEKSDNDESHDNNERPTSSILKKI